MGLLDTDPQAPEVMPTPQAAAQLNMPDLGLGEGLLAALGGPRSVRRARDELRAPVRQQVIQHITSELTDGRPNHKLIGPEELNTLVQTKAPDWARDPETMARLHQWRNSVNEMMAQEAKMEMERQRTMVEDAIKYGPGPGGLTPELAAAVAAQGYGHRLTPAEQPPTQAKDGDAARGRYYGGLLTTAEYQRQAELQAARDRAAVDLGVYHQKQDAELEYHERRQNIPTGKYHTRTNPDGSQSAVWGRGEVDLGRGPRSVAELKAAVMAKVLVAGSVDVLNPPERQIWDQMTSGGLDPNMKYMVDRMMLNLKPGESTLGDPGK